MFTPTNGKMGYLEYSSFKTHKITYDQTTLEWKMTSYGKEGKWTWATSAASRASGLLGTHDWKVFNDSRECGATFESSVKLSLTAINPSHLTSRGLFSVALLPLTLPG